MLYVVRHGQTPWNVQDIICGRVDIDLTMEGESQALALGKEIAKKGLSFSRVIASPLLRARKTAEIALCEAEAQMKKNEFDTASLYLLKPEQETVPFCSQEIEIDERLIEIDFGEIEGFHRLDETYLFYKKQFAVKYPGGESNFQVTQRVYNFLDELKADQYEKRKNGEEEQNILLVCHGGICRTIYSYFNNLTNEEFFEWSVDNAVLYEFSWE